MRQRQRKLRDMQKHHVDPVVPVGGQINGIGLDDDEPDELNELERLAGLADKTPTAMDLEISDDEENVVERRNT